MKHVIFTSLSLALLFTACQKESNTEFQSSNSTQKVAPLTVSEWKTVPADSWQLSSSANGQKTYSFSYSNPQITAKTVNEGAALTYIQGYNFSDASFNKPMELPFSFFSANEASTSAFDWKVTSETGMITVSVTMADNMEQEFLAAKAPVKLQYVLLSPEYIATKGLSPALLSRLSYNQVMNKVGTSL